MRLRDISAREDQPSVEADESLPWRRSRLVQKIDDLGSTELLDAAADPTLRSEPQQPRHDNARKGLKGEDPASRMRLRTALDRARWWPTAV
jgi:hypothetical protein